MENNMVLFEEHYIFRNYKSITSNNDVALTEFVANAWDAGAHNVNITIPYNEHEQIVVEDDGTGMSDEDISAFFSQMIAEQTRARYAQQKAAELAAKSADERICGNTRIAVASAALKSDVES